MTDAEKLKVAIEALAPFARWATVYRRAGIRDEILLSHLERAERAYWLLKRRHHDQSANP